jgi:uncharacterized protein (TIGR03663 family)
MTISNPKIRWTIFFAIAFAALAVRLPQLAERPMHTDEAINGYIIGDLLTGKPFHYDPQDRHGPVLYLIAKPIVKICGAKNFSELTETELRLTPVVIGSAMILLFGAAVEIFGFIPCLIAALLFAFAPLPVYYSRYFIHETLFVAATFGLILSGWQTLKKNSVLLAVLTGMCAALMLACKETAVIHFFALACAAFCGWLFKREKFPSPKIITTVFAVFIVATILLFTWFGQNWSALSDLAHAVSRFAARAGGEGHEKPLSYYLKLLGTGWSGALILTAAALGFFDALFSTRRVFFAVYSLLIAIIYSAIPYKQPWLALNLWLPLSLLAGIIVESCRRAEPKFHARLLVLFLVCIGGTGLAHDTLKYAFKIPADGKNPYAYAHTTDDILRLAPRLNELAQQDKISNPHIVVVMKDAWPLPWYLRGFFYIGFWQPEEKTGGADFFITASEPPASLTNRLNNFRPEFFGVRPNDLIILWTPQPPSP